MLQLSVRLCLRAADVNIKLLLILPGVTQTEGFGRGGSAPSAAGAGAGAGARAAVAPVLARGVDFDAVAAGSSPLAPADGGMGVAFAPDGRGGLKGLDVSLLPLLRRLWVGVDAWANFVRTVPLLLPHGDGAPLGRLRGEGALAPRGGLWGAGGAGGRGDGERKDIL